MVPQYKADYPICLDTRRFSAMFSNGHSMAMFYQWGSQRDTNMGACERRCNAITLWRLGYISRISPFDMLFVRHDHELEYFRNL